MNQKEKIILLLSFLLFSGIALIFLTLKNNYNHKQNKFLIIKKENHHHEDHQESSSFFSWIIFVILLLVIVAIIFKIIKQGKKINLAFRLSEDKQKIELIIDNHWDSENFFEELWQLDFKTNLKDEINPHDPVLNDQSKQFVKNFFDLLISFLNIINLPSFRPINLQTQTLFEIVDKINHQNRQDGQLNIGMKTCIQNKQYLNLFKKIMRLNSYYKDKLFLFPIPRKNQYYFQYFSNFYFLIIQVHQQMQTLTNHQNNYQDNVAIHAEKIRNFLKNE